MTATDLLCTPALKSDRIRRMREIRTSGVTRGRGELVHDIQLLRHEGETWIRN